MALGIVIQNCPIKRQNSPYLNPTHCWRRSLHILVFSVNLSVIQLSIMQLTDIFNSRQLLYRSQWAVISDTALKQISAFLDAGYQTCLRFQDIRARYLSQVLEHPQSALDIPMANTNLNCPWYGASGCPCGIISSSLSPRMKALSDSLKSFSDVDFQIQ